MGTRLTMRASVLVSCKASFGSPFTCGLMGCSLSESTITSGEGALFSDFMSLWSRDSELLSEHPDCAGHCSPETHAHTLQVPRFKQTARRQHAHCPTGGNLSPYDLPGGFPTIHQGCLLSLYLLCSTQTHWNMAGSRPVGTVLGACLCIPRNEDIYILEDDMGILENTTTLFSKMWLGVELR